MRCFVAFLVLAFTSAVFGQTEETVIVRNVTVVPMDEDRVLPGRTVVIRDGRIANVTEEEVEISAGAREIDGEGKFLMPGLAEMHAHVPGGGEEAAYREDVLFLYLANGVTLIRGMLGDPIHLELREKLEKGELDGPRLITSGPSFNGRSAPDPERAKKLVEEQKEAGYDFIKVAGGSRAAFDAMAEAAREADFPFSGHVPGEVGVLRALEAGYASIDHLDGYMLQLVSPERLEAVKDPGFFGYLLAPHVEEERIQEMARKTKEAGVWNVPTEALMESVLTVELEGIREARPEFRYLPKRVVDGWVQAVERRRAAENYDPEAAKAFMRVRLELIRALHEAGAGLLLGSDAPQFFSVPGFSLHRELEILADSGLSPFEILRTGTVAPAVFFEEEEDHGKVERGMRADLILLEANPLEDVRNAKKIAGVFRDGRWFSKEEIDRRLEEIAGRYER